MDSQTAADGANAQGATSENGSEYGQTRPNIRNYAAEKRLADIDTNLYNNGKSIEACRRELYQWLGDVNGLTRKCAMFEKAYNDEKQQHSQTIQAYRALQAQCAGSVNDLRSLATKYRSLRNELDETQTQVMGLQFQAEGYREQIANLTAYGKEESDPDIEQLQARIKELENENTELHNALGNITERLIDFQNNACRVETPGRKEEEMGTLVEHSQHSPAGEKRALDKEDTTRHEAIRPKKRGRRSKPQAVFV